MKTILCFGDSNTWGYSPVTGQRYKESQRWPALLAKLIPADYQIIEQGLPGRTTFFDDPAVGLVSGHSSLLPCLKKYQPDCVVLMLGTNDLKASFAQSAADISHNAAKLVQEILDFAGQIMKKTVTVCLVAPPEIAEVGYFGQLFAGGALKSQAFANLYAVRAEELGCDFFDAGSVVNSSPIDGIHWPAAQHRKMAAALAIKLKEILMRESAPIDSPYIFVYGTLRRGGNADMHALLTRYSEYVATAKVQGKLYALQTYPAMVESEKMTDQVLGELYKITDSRKLFALLDDYEECSEKFPLPHEYSRKQLPVKLVSGEQVRAWVYLYNRDVANLERIRCADYMKYRSELSD